jgi:hypothetical protein
MITPKQVFDAWPDNDLLPFDPPRKGETYVQYKERIGDEALSSDRLFRFVLAELCGEEDLPAEEADRRMERAIEDLETVRRKLELDE